jgi:hypothetical protein
MIRSLVIFAFGVYVGQEYGGLIPNVKLKTYEILDNFTQTDLYKKICDDIRNKDK